MNNNLQTEQDTTTTSTLEERLQNTEGTLPFQQYKTDKHLPTDLAQSTYKPSGRYIPPITQSLVTHCTWHWFTIKSPLSYFRF